jgi:hypothetical protein
VLLGAGAVAGPAGAEPDAVAAAPARIPDFNGDGFPDLAVGGPETWVRGIEAAGAVGVMYGKSNGLDARRVTAVNQAMAVVPDTLEVGDQFGETVRSGDFDGDGFADLAVGAPGEKRAGAKPGTLSILFGSGTGFTRGIVVAPRDQDGPMKRFASALAAGDFNKDGYTDLYATGWGEASPGYVVYGKAGLHQPGKAKLVKLADVAPVLDKGEPDIGDVTGDGYADLIVPRWRGTQSDVVVYKGSASGISTTPSQRVAGGGQISAVGDTDKDGFGDVAIGFPFATVASKPAAGHVRVWYGSAAGLNVARKSVVIHQETPRIPDVAEGSDDFGNDVSLGDIDKDGRADLAIGVPGESYGTKKRAGQVTILYGNAGGIVPATARIQSVSQDTTGVGETLEAYDNFGWSTDLRDYNRDGRADLVIAAIFDNDWEGVVHVLKGSATGVTGVASLTFGPSTVAMGHVPSLLGIGADG